MSTFSVSADSRHWIGGFVFELQCVKEAGNCIQQMQRTMTLHDKFGRQITDLRIPSRPLQLPLRLCRSADPENYAITTKFSPG